MCGQDQERKPTRKQNGGTEWQIEKESILGTSFPFPNARLASLSTVSLSLPCFSTQRNDRSSEWRVMGKPIRSDDERGGDFFGGTVFNIASRQDSPEDDTHKGHQRKVCRMHGINMFCFFLLVDPVKVLSWWDVLPRHLLQIPLS